MWFGHNWSWFGGEHISLARNLAGELHSDQQWANQRGTVGDVCWADFRPSSDWKSKMVPPPPDPPPRLFEVVQVGNAIA